MATITVEGQRTIRRPVALVSRQFGEIQHHGRNHVHPDIRFTVLSEEGDTCRFRQAVKLVGMLQTDEIVQHRNADGSLSWDVVEGVNKGAHIDQAFTSVGPDATVVTCRAVASATGIKRVLKPCLRSPLGKGKRWKRARGRSTGSGGTWIRKGTLVTAVSPAVAATRTSATAWFTNG